MGVENQDFGLLVEEAWEQDEVRHWPGFSDAVGCPSMVVVMCTHGGPGIAQLFQEAMARLEKESLVKDSQEEVMPAVQLKVQAYSCDAAWVQSKNDLAWLLEKRKPCGVAVPDETLDSRSPGAIVGFVNGQTRAR